MPNLLFPLGDGIFQGPGQPFSLPLVLDGAAETHLLLIVCDEFDVVIRRAGAPTALHADRDLNILHLGTGDALGSSQPEKAAGHLHLARLDEYLADAQPESEDCVEKDEVNEAENNGEEDGGALPHDKPDDGRPDQGEDG